MPRTPSPVKHTRRNARRTRAEWAEARTKAKAGESEPVSKESLLGLFGSWLLGTAFWVGAQVVGVPNVQQVIDAVKGMLGGG